METVDKLQEERIANYNKILTNMKSIKSIDHCRGMAKDMAVMVYEDNDGKSYQVVLSQANEFILYYTYLLLIGMKSSLIVNKEE